MCQICDHPQREAIDRAIVACDSLRKIATMFATDKDAVRRHKKTCMQRTLPALAAAIPAPAYQTPAELAVARQNVRSVAQRAGELVDKMEALAKRFEATGDTNGILKAAKEIREGLRLLAQLSGELSPNQVNLQVNVPSVRDDPAFPIIIGILRECPVCFAKVETALLEAGK